MDDKNSRYIVNGAHDSAKLAELLDIFIKKYVLCASCGNPETDIVSFYLSFFFVPPFLKKRESSSPT